MDILNEINAILKDRKIVSHDITGFDDSEKIDWYYFDLSSNVRKMGIDCCRVCTIYLGDWHGHYNPQTEWDEFIQTLNGIFDNELMLSWVIYWKYRTSKCGKCYACKKRRY